MVVVYIYNLFISRGCRPDWPQQPCPVAGVLPRWQHSGQRGRRRDHQTLENLAPPAENTEEVREVQPPSLHAFTENKIKVGDGCL